VHLVNRILCICEKELRYALRDTDVLIYGLLVPVLVYPLLLLAGGEVLIWQMSSGSQKFVLAIEPKNFAQLPPHFQRALEKCNEFRLQRCEQPQQELQRAHCDAVLIVKPAGADGTINLACLTNGKRGMIAGGKLSVLINSLR
jgi:hypothetical protein